LYNIVKALLEEIQIAQKIVVISICVISMVATVALALFLWLPTVNPANNSSYTQAPEASPNSLTYLPLISAEIPEDNIDDEIYDIYYAHEHLASDSITSCFIPVFTSEPLPQRIIDFITGRTFRDYAPFTTDFLTYLTVTHVDFGGNDRIGHMIVAAEIGDEVLEIFREIYESGFPIYSIKLIDYFDAIDYYSLEANNSSAFNFRYIANTTTISRHGFGMAIDINPIQNPYVRGDNVLPEAGRAYLDRTDVRPGMIIPGDAVYTAFTSRGWTWGGNWTLPRDYHHFERR